MSPLAGDAANVLVKVFRWQEVSKRCDTCRIPASGRYDNAAHQLDVPKLPNNYRNHCWWTVQSIQLLSGYYQLFFKQENGEIGFIQPII